MSLRIAHVTATFPPYHGGTGNVCYHNARELARRGHEVHVFTAATAGAPANELREGIAVHRLRALARVGNAPLLPSLLWRLRGFDIIHLHYPFILGAEMVRLVSMLYRTPMVISFHNDLIGDGMRKYIFTLYQRLSAYTTVRGASRLCAVSLDHYYSSMLCGALTRQKPIIAELPNGVDIDHFHPSESIVAIRTKYHIPLDAKLILFVAALDRAHHFKGLHTLLQSLRSLPASTWLLVVGDGDMHANYQQQATDLGVNERTIFAGAIDQEHIPPFFQAADMTVLPSSPPESFGLVLIESLACGTPVIASDLPGVRTVVAHGQDGLLAPPGDSGALAAAITDLLSDEPRRRAMGQAGRAKVETRYSWQAIGDRLEQIYQDALRDRTATASQYARGDQ